MVSAVFGTNNNIAIQLLLHLIAYNYVTAELYEGSSCELFNGARGVCKLLRKCNWVNEQVESGKMTLDDLRRSICCYQGNEQIVCCGDESPSEERLTTQPSVGGTDEGDLTFSTVRPTTSTPPVPKTPLRKIDAACAKYTEISSPLLSFNIIGGLNTTLGEFPHMAALGHPSEEINNNVYDFDCGGSLISDQYILTAAHCIRSTPTVVRMGKVTLHTNNDDTDGLTSNIAKIIRHPKYNSRKQYNDIALIKLEKPIEFNNDIRPACLRTNISDPDSNTELIATGWGVTSLRTGKPSESLLKTNVTIVSLETCNSTYFGYDKHRLEYGILPSQMCANDPIKGNDACTGDSGGPLQITNPNGMSTIIGITSFSIACGTPTPGVYTRVAYYIDWIESVVWPDF